MESLNFITGLCMESQEITSTSSATGFKIQDSGSKFVSALKWVFAVICAVGVIEKKYEV